MALFRHSSSKASRAAELHGQSIRYVTERRRDNDDVIGRGGSLSVKDGELLIFSSGDIIARFPVGSLDVSYLLSGDGVVLSGTETLSGSHRTVIAHFVYYRK